MDDQTSPKWYLNVQGAKTGPYTTDQIKGLFEEGEIRPDCQVTADFLHGEWITVKDLMESYKTSEAPLIAGPADFQPPPRPPGVIDDQNPSPQAPKPRPRDPAIGLLETLKVAKKRRKDADAAAQQQATQAPTEPDINVQIKRVRRQQIIVLVAVLVVAVAAIIGFARMIKNRFSTPDSQPVASPAPATMTPTNEPPVFKPTFPQRNFPTPKAETPPRDDRREAERDDRDERDRERDRERDQDREQDEGQDQTAERSHPVQPSPPPMPDDHSLNAPANPNDTEHPSAPDAQFTD